MFFNKKIIIYSNLPNRSPTKFTHPGLSTVLIHSSNLSLLIICLLLLKALHNIIYLHIFVEQEIKMLHTQRKTYFSDGIIKAREREVYDVYINRFNDLEDGELIDIYDIEDCGFFTFLSKAFKRKHVVQESAQVYSIKLE